jgi:hypothetical protein
MRPGKKHSRVRVMLMMESAVQNPVLIQTGDAYIDQHANYRDMSIRGKRGGMIARFGLPAIGGKKMARTARKMSELHMAHGCFVGSDSRM